MMHFPSCIRKVDGRIAIPHIEIKWANSSQPGKRTWAVYLELNTEVLYCDGHFWATVGETCVLHSFVQYIKLVKRADCI